MNDTVLVSRDGADAVVLGSDGFRAVMRDGVWSTTGSAWVGEDWVDPDPKRAITLATAARTSVSATSPKS